MSNTQSLYIPASGGDLTIGNAVSGGGANRVLYEDGSQNLAATNNFRFITSTLLLGEAGGDKGAVTLNGNTSGAVTLSVANAAGTYVMYLPNAQGTANTTLVNNGSGGLSWSRTTGQITGATGSSATATIPSGMTNCILSVKNETNPTTPFTTEIMNMPQWNISGTTLTVYFGKGATNLAVSNSYTISYMVW